MKKSVIILLHIGFWLCYSLLILIMLGLLFKNKTYEIERIYLLIKYLLAFAVIPSIIAFYGFYFKVFPYYLKDKNISKSIAYALLVSLTVGLIGTALVYSIDGEDHLYNIQDDFIVGMVVELFIALILGTVALVLRGFITWFGDIKLKEALQQKIMKWSWL